VIRKKADYIMMNRLFNSDNPFWQSMNTLFDLFVLNALWLICCIPIITIGPATTALSYTLIERIQGTGGYITRDFFNSFKQNFKQGLQLGIPLTLLGGFLTLDVYMCYHAGGGIYSFFMAFFAVLLLIWASMTLYVFPVLSKFERKNMEIIVWAFTLSIKNIGMTFLMLAFILICLWMCHIWTGMIFIIFGIIGQFCSTIMASIFKPFYPKDDDDEFGNFEEKDYMDYDNIQDLF
jgi:uncharacterized membrane protein YesL